MQEAPPPLNYDKLRAQFGILFESCNNVKANKTNFALILNTMKRDDSLRHVVDKRTPINSNTLLIICVLRKRYDMAQTLLECGADVTVQDCNGYNVLMHTLKDTTDEGLGFMELLLNTKKVDIHAKNKTGSSAIVLASYSNDTFVNLKMVSMLILNGANFMDKTSDLRTPLHIAASLGFLKLCELLIKKGAVLDALTSSKRSPLVLAMEANMEAAAALLVKRGCNSSNDVKIGNTTVLAYAALHKMKKLEEVIFAKVTEICDEPPELDKKRKLNEE